MDDLLNRSIRKVLLIYITIFCVFFVFTTSSHGARYREVYWQSTFPELERRFPSLIFESENSFHLTVFSMDSEDMEIERIEFKLFQNRLTAIVHKYFGSLNQFMKEKYLHEFIPGLGRRQKVDKRKIPTAQGMTDTVLWDYSDVQVFFQSYPVTEIKGELRPFNIIKFVHKSSFIDMKKYINENPDGDPDILDDDFDALSF